MFSLISNTKAVRLTTTGLIAAFLAVCTLSVAPGAGATGQTQPSTVTPSSSGQSIQADGFHW